MKKLEGTAIKELVEGGRLKRADILLIHSKHNLLGWLIRFGTRSYWNHALMTYVIRDITQGYEATFIIESAGGSGVDIHNIAHYFERPKKYDVGIKRLEAGWFQDDREVGGLRYRRRVRGFALLEIDDKYDHRLLLRIAGKILRQLILALLFPWQRSKAPDKRRVQVLRVMGLDVNAYICSGFVQWAYYLGVSRILDEDGLDKSRLQDVIFNPRLAGQVTENEMLSTTPADLANTDKLSWKYIVKNGVAWEISSKDEADTILR